MTALFAQESRLIADFTVAKLYEMLPASRYTQALIGFRQVKSVCV